MKDQPDIKLFALVETAGGVPSQELSEALLAHADQEIELRVYTRSHTSEALEQYAQDLARATDRVLLAIRQSDWHNPPVEPSNPYFFLTKEWWDWVIVEDKRRQNNARIRIVDSALSSALESARNREPLRCTHPSENPPLNPITLQRLWGASERALWLARELAGVSEITLLPKTTTMGPTSVCPITATFATKTSIEAVQRGLALLAEKKKPLAAAREIIFGATGADSDTMRAHNARRIALYSAHWHTLCAVREHDPLMPMRVCVCRTPPKNFGEFVEQWGSDMAINRLHRAECYKRLVDILTYQSDWQLACDGFADAVGERHSLIAYYNGLAERQRKDADRNESR